MKRSSPSKRSLTSQANTIFINCLQAQSLTKLRHPDLLQITEPLEETRSELTFVTEAITGSLTGILKDLSENVHGPGSDRNRGAGGSGGPEVDEVEVSRSSCDSRYIKAGLIGDGRGDVDPERGLAGLESFIVLA
jgi:hypothetical protein